MDNQGRHDKIPTAGGHVQKIGRPPNAKDVEKNGGEGVYVNSLGFAALQDKTTLFANNCAQGNTFAQNRYMALNYRQINIYVYLKQNECKGSINY